MKAKKRIIKKTDSLLAKPTKKIPPPPGANVSWEKQAAYFDKYGIVDLEEAGYLMPLNRKDKKLFEELRKAAKHHLDKRKREQLNLSLQPSQFDRLEQAARNLHLQPTTLARSWILERLDEEVPA